MKTQNILLGIGAIIAIDYLIAQSHTQPKITYHKKLPFNYNAQTLPPFGIKIKEEHKDNKLLLTHELVHWQQYQRAGAILYYGRYLFEMAIYGYDEMPMEIEARKYVGESNHCQHNYTDCVKHKKAITVANLNFRKV